LKITILLGGGKEFKEFREFREFREYREIKAKRKTESALSSTNKKSILSR